MEKIELCPECGGNIVVLMGEKICRKCGLVLESNLLDDSAEWRAYTQEEYEEKCRVGDPITPLIHDKSLTTKIGASLFDSKGRRIPEFLQNRILKLRKLQERTKIFESERCLLEVLSQISRFSNILNLPMHIKIEASIICRKIYKEGNMKGRRKDALALATLYFACRIHNLPYTLRDLVINTGMKKREVARACRFILNTLNLKLPPLDPINFAKNYIKRLGLPDDIFYDMKKVLEIIKNDIQGRTPRVVVSSLLYLIAQARGIPLTQRDISLTIGITEVSLRNCNHIILEALRKRGINDFKKFLEMKYE